MKRIFESMDATVESETWRKGVTTFISQARAEEILKEGGNRYGEYSKSCTLDEAEEIRRLWKLNPSGYSSFYTTLCRVRQGHFKYAPKVHEWAQLKQCLREDDLRGDPWGTVMSWWFAISDELHFNRKTEVPAHWQYRPSPIASGVLGGDYGGDYAADAVRDFDDETLVKFGNVLCRYAQRLKLAERDY